MGKPRAERDDSIDLTRGVAVVCMVQFHTVDSFASAATKVGWFGQLSVFFGGGAAPLFLSLAGLGAALGFYKKGRQALPLVARGVEILSIGLLFRVQEWALGGEGASSLSLLRVDVLNCIGVSLVAVALVLAITRRWAPKHGAIALLTLGAAIIGVTPAVARAPWLAQWPPALAYYFGGPLGNALFPMFGWTGVACLGAALGAVASDRSSTQPVSTQPVSTQPVSTQPVSTQPVSTQPVSTQPVSTQPVSTQPVSTQPVSTQPVSTQPVSTQPAPLQRWSRLCLLAYPVLVLVRVAAPDALGLSRANTDPIFTLERAALSLGLIAVLARLSSVLPDRCKRLLLLYGAHSLSIYWVHVELAYGLWFHRFKGRASPVAATLAALAMLAAMALFARAYRAALASRVLSPLLSGRNWSAQ